MTALTKDAPRAYQVGEIEEYPVIASDVIYEGAAVGENAAGHARPLTAGDVFLGFAEAQVDNSAGAAGDAGVRVKTRGRIELNVESLAITANDRAAVYASDDDTFTLTVGANSKIGYISKFVSTGVGVVQFFATEA
jgi:hypothetical protein